MSKQKPTSFDHHETLEIIKVPVVLDGDTAWSLLNMLYFVNQHDFLADLVFCDNALPKIGALVERLEKYLDIENREEP